MKTGDVKHWLRRLAGRIEEQQEAERAADARPDPPRHQQKGPIVKGPRAYLPCWLCTALMAEDGKRVRIIGTTKQGLRAHLESHRQGRIVKPTGPDA